MARIRTVKPDFWADEKLASVSRDARLFFIGLFNFADDEGRLRGSPLLLRSQVFPYDLDVDTESLLRVLVEKSLIVRYEVAAESYVFVRNFSKHQKIDRPSPSVLPDPPREVSTRPRRKLDEASLLEGKGREEEGSGKEGRAPPAAAAPPDSPFVIYVRENWPDVKEPQRREAEWADACPAVDLLAEAKKAVSWERESPANRKVDHGAFFGRWARKAQDTPDRHRPTQLRGPGAAAGAKPVASPEDFDRDEADFQRKKAEAAR